MVVKVAVTALYGLLFFYSYAAAAIAVWAEATLMTAHGLLFLFFFSAAVEAAMASAAEAIVECVKHNNTTGGFAPKPY